MAGAYPGLLSIHEACIRVLLLPPGWDARPSPGYPPPPPPQQHVADPYLYTWVKRDKVE